MTHTHAEINCCEQATPLQKQKHQNWSVLLRHWPKCRVCSFYKAVPCCVTAKHKPAPLFLTLHIHTFTHHAGSGRTPSQGSGAISFSGSPRRPFAAPSCARERISRCPPVLMGKPGGQSTAAPPRDEGSLCTCPCSCPCCLVSLEGAAENCCTSAKPVVTSGRPASCPAVTVCRLSRTPVG